MIVRLKAWFKKVDLVLLVFQVIRKSLICQLNMPIRSKGGAGVLNSTV